MVGCELDCRDTEQSHAYSLDKDYWYKGKGVTCESLLLSNLVDRECLHSFFHDGLPG